MVIFERRAVVVSEGFLGVAGDFKGVGEASMPHIMAQTTENDCENILFSEYVEVGGQGCQQIAGVHDYVRGNIPLTPCWKLWKGLEWIS